MGGDDTHLSLLNRLVQRQHGVSAVLAGAVAHHANGPSIVLAVELERFAVLRAPGRHSLRRPRSPGAPAGRLKRRSSVATAASCRLGRSWLGPARARDTAGRAARRTACGTRRWPSLPGAPSSVRCRRGRSCALDDTGSRKSSSRWGGRLLLALLPAPTPRPRRWAGRGFCAMRPQLTEVGRRWGKLPEPTVRGRGGSPSGR